MAETAAEPEIIETKEQGELLPLEREYTFWVFIKSANRANDGWKPKPIANFKTVQ